MSLVSDIILSSQDLKEQGSNFVKKYHKQLFTDSFDVLVGQFSDEIFII